MTIDKIRELISIELSSHILWTEILSDTDPGHFGINYFDCYVDINDIYVKVPERQFTFKNGSLKFNVTLGASKGDYSHDMDFDKTVSGHGEFTFKDSTHLEILSFEAEFDKSLFI